MLENPETWVALSFVLFVGLMLYLKVPAMAAKMLDARADRIRAELDEARKLREEAQGMLAQYQRRRKEAEDEADAIVAHARDEAEALQARAQEDIKAQIARRMKAAEDKISQAEADAIQEVRSRAASLAIVAAEASIRDGLTKTSRDNLVTDAIAAVKDRLH